jgi:enamine deaminase RidA (YjgF/YER057c/UK114 family)
MIEPLFPIQRLKGVVDHRSSGSAYNGFVFCVSTSPTSEGGITQQARDLFARLDRLLDKLGSHRSLILQTTIYLAHHEQKPEFDKAWAEWIGNEPVGWPQRCGIAVELAPHTLVEVSLIAAQRADTRDLEKRTAVLD